MIVIVLVMVRQCGGGGGDVVVIMDIGMRGEIVPSLLFFVFEAVMRTIFFCVLFAVKGGRRYLKWDCLPQNIRLNS